MAAPVGGWHSSGTRLASDWHPEWFDAWRTVDARAADVDAARALLDGIALPTTFAERRAGDGVAAVGMGVLDRDWIGIYCMATLPHARRQGHAGEILRALLGRGRDADATRAHLFVTEANTGAQALYRSFGFEPARAYSYFTAAG
jgi:N-acetylglutamate synthase